MSTLYKFKFLCGFVAMAIFFVGTFLVAHNAHAYTYTAPLNLGSTGPDVASLQQRLGVNPVTGYFDYTTRGAVVTFQLAHKLVADGVVGPATGHALSVVVSTPKPIQNSNTSSYPSGCTSHSGFSATTGTSCAGSDPSIPLGCTSHSDYTEFSRVTGLPCVDHATYPSGCTSASGYSNTTGLSCSIPIGCTTHSGYSKATGESCDSSSFYQPLYTGCTSRTGYSATSGVSCATGLDQPQLQGTSGSLDSVKKVQGYGNTRVYRDATNSYFAGYILAADKGSDLLISSMKISLEMTDGDASSRLDRYASKISVFENGYQVGTANVDDFSENNDVYTARIELSSALVYEDEQSYFYLAADSLEDIDSSNKDNTWTATLSEIRYRDAQGETFTDDVGANSDTDFHFSPSR